MSGVTEAGDSAEQPGEVEPAFGRGERSDRSSGFELLHIAVAERSRLVVNNGRLMFYVDDPIFRDGVISVDSQFFAPIAWKRRLCNLDH